MSQNVRPLDKLKLGEKARVVALAGGRSFQDRLVGMGINVGSPVELLRAVSGNGGPAVVAAGSSRLAIGRGMAAKIMVSVDSPLSMAPDEMEE